MQVSEQAAFLELLHSDFLIWTTLGLFLVCIVAIRSMAGVFKYLSRERTRREIAAYIAEGTLTPEQGERLMNAGKFSC